MIEYRPIKGLEQYAIGSDGTLMRYAYSFYPKRIFSRRSMEYLQFKPQNDKDGYIIYHILGKTYKAHRLVAESFIENPFKKGLVNHINGIKNDNRIENLEWCTQSENHIHAFKIGLKKGRDVSKEKNPRYKTGINIKGEKEKKCLYCGKVFMPQVIRVVYCSKKCSRNGVLKNKSLENHQLF